MYRPSFPEAPTMHTFIANVPSCILDEAEALTPPKSPEPALLSGKKRLKGLEPSTFCMASRRSSQLSYSRNDGGQVYRGRRFDDAALRRARSSRAASHPASAAASAAAR